MGERPRPLPRRRRPGPPELAPAWQQLETERPPTGSLPLAPVLPRRSYGGLSESEFRNEAYRGTGRELMANEFNRPPEMYRGERVLGPFLELTGAPSLVRSYARARDGDPLGSAGEAAMGALAIGGVRGAMRAPIPAAPRSAPALSSNGTTRGIARPLPNGQIVMREAVTEPQTVRTSWGAELRAEPGRDYIVSTGPDDRWVVRQDIFDTTYRPEGGGFRKRDDLMHSFYVSPDERTIDTLEGPVTANPGDYVMNGSVGEQWPVSPSTFERRYRVQSEPESARVLHGSAAPLRRVRPGLFTTTNRETAEFFAGLDRRITGGRRRVTPLDIQMRYPLELNGRGYMLNNATMRQGALPRVLETAQRDGHDAVVFRNVTDGPGAANRDQMPIDVYVVLDPQIARTLPPQFLDDGHILSPFVEHIRSMVRGDARVIALPAASSIQTQRPPAPMATPWPDDMFGALPREPLPRPPSPEARLPGRASDGSVLPVAPTRPFTNSLRGGSDDLSEAARDEIASIQQERVRQIRNANRGG